MRSHTAGFAAVAIGLLLAGCSNSQSPLVVSDLDVQDPLPGSSMGRAYLSIENTTDSAITITSVRSVNYASVSLHESVIEDGIARMRSIDELTIAAGDIIELAPGGLHLMLHKKVNDAATTEFVFYSGDTPVLSVATTHGD